MTLVTNIINQIDISKLASLSPQAVEVLQYMDRTGSITQREALLDLSVQSLTKRISELRGVVDIETDNRKHKTTRQRYARYFLKGVRRVAV
jgi:hypothetical protein